MPPSLPRAPWRRLRTMALLRTLLVLPLILPLLSAQEVRYVVHVSVDGLRPDAIAALPAVAVPNLRRLRTEGVGTDNARCDFDYSITLPNHVTQLTGRRVAGPTGHNWTSNSDPAAGQTLATNKGAYIAGVFDVAHDHGLRTAAYVGKTKFSLFAVSWNALNGYPDPFPPDDGRNKIDLYRYGSDSAALVAQFAADQLAQPAHYVFIHLTDLDTIGHASGWDPTPGSNYSNALRGIDARLGAIFQVIADSPVLNGHTALLVTADHGGTGKEHNDATLATNYTVPFHAWAPGVAAGADLYTINPLVRQNPGTGRPAYSASPQPVRNGEAANLALQFLGLGPVPGSTVNAARDLAVGVPVPHILSLAVGPTGAALTFTSAPGALYDVKYTDDLAANNWADLIVNLPGTGFPLIATDPPAGSAGKRFYKIIAHF